MEGLYLPHEATWRRSGPRPAGEAGVDGGLYDDGVAVLAMFDPLTPAIAESKYGVTGVDRPHLVFLDTEVCSGIREDDILSYQGVDLIVRLAREFDHPDFSHIEVIAAGRTRGRA